MRAVQERGVPVDASHFYLTSLFLEAGFRGTGAADWLMRHYLDQGRDRGFLQFRLDVEIGNAQAIRFYERHGFTCSVVSPSLEHLSPIAAYSRILSDG